jgi:hypothetical protein
MPNAPRQSTPVQTRIINAAVDIWGDDPLDIVYQHSLFCQIALPRRRTDARIFERSYQNGQIRIEAGVLYEDRAWIEQPMPAGAKPRLALIHINSEAVRTRNPLVEVDSSVRQFMARLGLNTDGGRDQALFKREMKALAACRMSLGFRGPHGSTTVDVKPIERFDAWITPGDATTQWPGQIGLSQRYFETLLAHAVPLDPRALSALTHSALAIDAYQFFARRLFSLAKAVKVTWTQFHGQFGQEYMGKDPVKDFQREWWPACRAALTVYPDAKVELVRGGLMLHPSPPPIHSTAVNIPMDLSTPPPRLSAAPVIPPQRLAPPLPAPAQPRHLKPLTVERFHRHYPGLDPYACQADFEAWVAQKTPPVNYDAAFLGFAKTWAKRCHEPTKPANNNNHQE